MFTRGMRHSFVVCAAALFAATSVAAAPTPDPPLNRDLSVYFIFSMRHTHLKDMKMTQRGCNVGVNCQRPSAHSDCGVILHDAPYYADDSQIAGCTAKFAKPGGSIWQLFTDHPMSLENVVIRHPGINPDGTNPCNAPILPDVDGDGQPSCQTVGQQCVPDFGDLYASCDFPVSFPACDPGKPVKAAVQADCAGDTQPGNEMCDLAPGVYGDVQVLNGATLNLDGPGEYVMCSLVAGRNVKIFGPGAMIYVPDGGQFKVNNGSIVGLNCGDVGLKVNGAGTVHFGRNSSINMRVCAPESTVRLGHGNKLFGQFFGYIVDSDASNEGGCCPGMCTCFDTLDPTQAHEGDTITLESHCDLTVATSVEVCGITAPMLTQTSDKITAQVPVGTSGSVCDVEVLSPAGTFIHVDQLTVL